MTHISYRSGVSIGELVVYLPALAIATFLAIRHGFGRSSGWRFLILFALARIIGACFQLATINDPTNQSLYTGEWVLLNISLSPLELISLGLLSRVISSINKTRTTPITPQHIRILEFINTVGLALAIAGGIQAGNDFAKTGTLTPQDTAKAALGLFIASFVLITIGVAAVYPSISYAEVGEKRLLAAIAMSLPFMLVRLVYSAISVFGHRADFNSVTGNVTILLCLALIQEFVIVVIYEAVGLTLNKVERPLEPSVDLRKYQGPTAV